MKVLYPAWINYKAEETTPANATKLQWVWDTYYRDSEIVKMDIADIDVVIMKEWFLKTVRKHQLTSKKYKEKSCQYAFRLCDRETFDRRQCCKECPRYLLQEVCGVS